MSGNVSSSNPSKFSQNPSRWLRSAQVGNPRNAHWITSPFPVLFPEIWIMFTRTINSRLSFALRSSLLLAPQLQLPQPRPAVVMFPRMKKSVVDPVTRVLPGTLAVVFRDRLSRHSLVFVSRLLGPSWSTWGSPHHLPHQPINSP